MSECRKFYRTVKEWYFSTKHTKRNSDNSLANRGYMLLICDYF